jgi:hypothetical protein
MMMADGEELPKVRIATDILRHDAYAAAAIKSGDALVAIPLLVDSGRPARANISLDSGLLQAIDDAAKRRGLTRSAFIASTMRDKIFTHA